MHHKVMIEPFRIKSVEPIPIIPFEQRVQLLEDAHYNLFLLPARDVMIDLLTDSGTSAMSAKQWGAMMTGDEAYAGSESYYAFRDAVRDIFTLPQVIPTHQGRAAEHLLFVNICQKGQLVPNNTHFDTTRANLEYLGVEAVDLPLAEAKDCRAYHPFKGNMDVDALEALLEREHERVPFVMLTITNNTSGGQPVSLENVKAVKQVASRYGLPLYIDAARFAENAYFIKAREPGHEGETPLEIAQSLFRLADGVLMSAKKDGMANIGGFLAVRDAKLAENLRNYLVLTEGFPTYGGLAGRDLAALAVGFYEALDEAYLRYRIRTAEYMAEKLRNLNIPLMEPPGGHAIYLDAKALAPHLSPRDFPGQSLVCALYLYGCIRSVEVGSVMFGSAEKPGHAPPNELVRLAFPRRVYTQGHFDYIVEVLGWIKDIAARLPAMKIVHQPPFLRHFTSHFQPSHPFPEMD